MIFILDTDILSLLGHDDSPEAPRIRRHIAELPVDDSVATTIINYEEQMRGWMALVARAKSMNDEIQTYSRLLKHLQTFRRINVLSYDQSATAIEQRLKAGKLKIGAMDLKIASIAIASNAILITRNLADFRNVTELRTEDWSVE
ncbi:MAG TPA: type II toxin-antitoxin system VapC family toxin [Tepidisphaeraceae bacterium]|jgi:tRNA(fMet)-specific endonuclease VapC